MRLNQSRIIGATKTTILKIVCTFCIFAFLESAKVQKMQRYLRNFSDYNPIHSSHYCPL